MAKKTLSGAFAYSIQGYMNTRSIRNQNPERAARFRAGFLNPAPYYKDSVPLLALPGIYFVTAAVAVAPGGAVLANGTVTITTAAPHGFLVGQSVIVQGVGDNKFVGTFTIVSVPSPNSFTYAHPGPNAESGGGTVISDPSQPHGFLPYVEQGYMEFDGKGGLNGDMRLNVSGVYSDFGSDSGADWLGNSPSPFHGRYKFKSNNSYFTPSYFNSSAPDADPSSPQGNLPFGLISISFYNPVNPFPNFIWDYSFVLVSDDELLLATAGRFPRPVVASGTMRRMKISAYGDHVVRRVPPPPSGKNLKKTQLTGRARGRPRR